MALIEIDDFHSYKPYGWDFPASYVSHNQMVKWMVNNGDIWRYSGDASILVHMKVSTNGGTPIIEMVGLSWKILSKCMIWGSPTSGKLQLWPLKKGKMIEVYGEQIPLPCLIERRCSKNIMHRMDSVKKFIWVCLKIVYP